jgi:hypothetical protein
VHVWSGAAAGGDWESGAWNLVGLGEV